MISTSRRLLGATTVALLAVACGIETGQEPAGHSGEVAPGSSKGDGELAASARSLRPRLASDILRRTGYFGDHTPVRRALSASGATVIYVNFDGVTLTAAQEEDATRNLHYGQECTVPAIDLLSPANREIIVEYVRRDYGAFNVQVVDRRPTSGVYHMAVVGGCPDVCGLWKRDAGVGGCAGLDCGNASEKNIAYVYPLNYLGRCGNAQPVSPDDWVLAEIAIAISHEMGHAFGLDHTSHEDAVCDMMSYGFCPDRRKRFLDEEMELAKDAGGSYEADTCGPTRLNSYRLLLAALGANPTRPQVSIQSPREGDTVGTKVTVSATAGDDLAVDTVELRVDGELIDTKQEPPYDFQLTLAAGQHGITVSATDGAGLASAATITVHAAQSTDPAPDPTAPGGTEQGPHAPASTPYPDSGAEHILGSCSLAGPSGADQAPVGLTLLLLASSTIRRRRRGWSGRRG